MIGFFAAVTSKTRSVLLALAFILIAGTWAYVNIPKEANPDIKIPVVYVLMTHQGISPEDAERLLVRPMEVELRSVEGVKEMKSQAMDGMAAVTLEFNAGYDIDKALEDVRTKVDVAKKDLPADTDEPQVKEINFAKLPVVTVNLYGPVSERVLLTLARRLKDDIQALKQVLAVETVGDREELLEVVVDPLRLEAYNIDTNFLLQAISGNNQLVAAGALDTGKGRFGIKVPGLIENAEDVFNLPIKVNGDTVVKLGDVASIRRTYKDVASMARFDGQPSVALEVSKRLGENLIDTVARVQEVVAHSSQSWPAGVEYRLTQDQSGDIRDMLSELLNSVIAAAILVMVIIIATMGWRSGILVGLAIPGSFLMGILAIAAMGLTVNIVVLFSLILAVGMLVDDSIVVVEYADRKMQEGMARGEAYVLAARRMFWPITAATTTRLAAFFPLLFWPDVVGEFMKYMPITLIATLTASLLMAVVFAPTLGAMFGKPDLHSSASMIAAESGSIDDIKGFTGTYARTLRWLVAYPYRSVLLVVSTYVLLVFLVWAYGAFGKKVEFFPHVEPEFAEIHVHARGNLSVQEKNNIMKEVEERVIGLEGIDTVYARTGIGFEKQTAPDTIGIFLVEFTDWKTRPLATEILETIRQKTRDIPGIYVEPMFEKAGPPVGKDVQIEISSSDPALVTPASIRIREKLESDPELRDIEDTKPLPGIEWEITVDRAQAGLFGANVSGVGQVVQLVTTGIKVGTYRPDDADDEIDIRVRFPLDDRTMNQLDQLKIPGTGGLVPVSNFVKREPVQRTGTLYRVDGKRVETVKANVQQGLVIDNKVKELQAWLKTQDFDPGLSIKFRGADEKQAESQAFLQSAFVAVLFLMVIVLVMEFNSFSQVLLILSAVILSTGGVLLGLLVSGQAFSIVMTGIGIIALAGIIVNNNIILIDTYNYLRRGGMELKEALVRTGAQRLRPVFLTAVTAVIGLLPMVFQWSINFTTREVHVGAPSTQWWVQLSTAIAFGLSFATILTLVVTPCSILFGHALTNLFKPSGPKKQPPVHPDQRELPQSAPAE